MITLRPHCFVYLKRKRMNPSLTSVLGLLAMIKMMSLSRESFHSLIFSTGIYFTMNLSYPAQQKNAFFRSGFPNWIRIKRLNKHTKTNKNKPFTILLLTARYYILFCFEKTGIFSTFITFQQLFFFQAVILPDFCVSSLSCILCL